VKVLVIRTDEEGEIARQTVKTIENAGRRHNLSDER
jgi:acetate kinase